MTQEQKAKAYDEALDWMRKLYPGLQGAAKEDAEHYFPELRKSEAVKIIDKIVDCLDRAVDVNYITLADKVKCLAYLAEPREVFKYGPGLYLYDGEHTNFCGEPVTKEIQKPVRVDPKHFTSLNKPIEYPVTPDDCKLKSAGDIYENCRNAMDQEQKPVDIDYISGIREELLSIENNAKDIDGLTESQWVAIRAAHRLLGEYVEKEQKPAEWNKEDDELRNNVIEDIKYLRTTTIAVKLVREYDRKIAWLEHLNPDWKPTEHQMLVLLNAEGTARANGCLGDAMVLASIYEQLKKLGQ